MWLAALAALLLLPVARGVVPEWRVLPAAPVVFAAPVVQLSAAPASVPAAEALAPYGDAIWRAAASLVGESEPDPVTLPEEIAA